MPKLAFLSSQGHKKDEVLGGKITEMPMRYLASVLSLRKKQSHHVSSCFLHHPSQHACRCCLVHAPAVESTATLAWPEGGQRASGTTHTQKKTAWLILMRFTNTKLMIVNYDKLMNTMHILTVNHSWPFPNPTIYHFIDPWNQQCTVTPQGLGHKLPRTNPEHLIRFHFVWIAGLGAESLIEHDYQIYQDEIGSYGIN